MGSHKFDSRGQSTSVDNKSDGTKTTGKVNEQVSKVGVCKIKVKILEYSCNNIAQLAGWILFSLLFILGLILPNGSFLELLYRLHETAIYSLIAWLFAIEVIRLIHGFTAKSRKADLITHLLWGTLIIIILFCVNHVVYEKLVGPKLTTIEIMQPQNGSEIFQPTVEVAFFVRNIEWPVYLIVETPQGTPWIQHYQQMQHNKFKDILKQYAQLGDGSVGVGGTFRIFAIGTTENLETGHTLEKIPPQSIVSNTVAVRRVR